MIRRPRAYVLTVTLWSLAACKAHDAAHGSAVSAEQCRSSCGDTRLTCSDRCSDEVCRSDCAATASRCELACDRSDADAGADQRDAGDSARVGAGGEHQKIPRVTDAAVAADAEPTLNSAGNDGAERAGRGAAGTAAGSGGTAGGAAGVGDDTGGLGGMAPPPNAGNGGYLGIAGNGPVGGFGLPVAGLHGPVGGEQF